MNGEVAGKVAVLWADPAIQAIYKNRAHYHIDDSSTYFFAHIERIGACDGYLPTDLDILYVRYRTTGMIEAQFSIDKSKFTILDVSGHDSDATKITAVTRSKQWSFQLMLMSNCDAEP